jgi:hypothetical protein
MSKYLKRIFGKENDDDIPEMKLQKNEPKMYYNTTLKCWLIEGQEEQMMKELEARNKPPVKMQKEPKAPTTAADKGKKPVSRYLSVLAENQQEVKNEQPEADRPTNTNEPQIFLPQPTISDNKSNEGIEPAKENINDEINKLDEAGSEPHYEDKAGNTLFVKHT